MCVTVCALRCRAAAVALSLKKPRWFLVPPNSILVRVLVTLSNRQTDRTTASMDACAIEPGNSTDIRHSGACSLSRPHGRLVVVRLCGGLKKFSDSHIRCTHTPIYCPPSRMRPGAWERTMQVKGGRRCCGAGRAPLRAQRNGRCPCARDVRSSSDLRAMACHPGRCIRALRILFICSSFHARRAACRACSMGSGDGCRSLLLLCCVPRLKKFLDSRDINDAYHIGDVLGRGAYSVVKAAKAKKTDEEVRTRETFSLARRL